jgi:deoxyribonuclease V
VVSDAGHPWDISPRQAKALQLQLRDRVVTLDRLGTVRRVAGIDVGFEDEGRITRAAVAVLAYPSLELIESAVALKPTSFPYVPGLLSFRELPAVLEALARLHTPPDLLLCDGQGWAHPRRFGLACHVGLLTDTPSIGVAKSRLIGDHGPLGPVKGSRTPLLKGTEVLGAVLRSRTGVAPIYVSIGHRISLGTAIAYVLACTTRYRLPETTRWAHRLASEKQPGTTTSRTGRQVQGVRPA